MCRKTLMLLVPVFLFNTALGLAAESAEVQALEAETMEVSATAIEANRGQQVDLDQAIALGLLYVLAGRRCTAEALNIKSESLRHV